MTKLIYLTLPYHLIAWYDDDEQRWFARVEEFRGCLADSDTRQAALMALEEVMTLWLEVRLEHGFDILKPYTERIAS
jgi:predicted RNase H-like HicB family nuclease